MSTFVCKHLQVVGKTETDDDCAIVAEGSLISSTCISHDCIFFRPCLYFFFFTYQFIKCLIIRCAEHFDTLPFLQVACLETNSLYMYLLGPGPGHGLVALGLSHIATDLVNMTIVILNYHLTL